MILACAERVEALAFSPDGRLLAAFGARDGIGRVWELATGELAYRLAAHRDGVTAVAFAPDGRTVASGGDNGCILLWDLTGRRALGHPPRPLGDADLARLWGELAADAPTALRAVWALASSPGAVPMLRERLRQPAPSAEHVAALLADLDAPSFAPAGNGPRPSYGIPAPPSKSRCAGRWSAGRRRRHTAGWSGCSRT